MEKEKTYVILDSIGQRTRVLVSLLLIAAGFALQWSTKNILVGLPLIVACVLLNFVKSVSIKKIRPQKLTWREVTPQRINDVLEHCAKIKRFSSGNTGCVVAFAILIFLAISFGVPILHLLARLSFSLVATVVNAVILFGGLAISGRRSAWMPHALDIKAKIVERMIASSLITSDPVLQAVPYLEIGKSDDGEFPNDTRFLIRFQNAPKSFIGLQGQISINSVKSRAYPYFYCVLIAKSDFKLFEKFGKHTLDKIVIEQKRTKEVDVIVVRQHTTKTSGYHTNKAVQDYILRESIKLVKSLL